VIVLLFPIFNDAALGSGGTPTMLHGNTTVRMASEKIVVNVDKEKTSATCTFVFQNDGPACKIKVGFPDHAYGAADPEEDADPAARKKPPKRGAMNSFHSWVDGKEVKMSLERGKEAGDYWHTKSVTFKGHGQTVVRDTYTLDRSSAIVMFKDKSGSADYAGYVVSTGSSWKGNIGRSEVVFQMPSSVKSVVASKTVTGRDRREFTVASMPAGQVVYSGMSKPTARGRTLAFVRTDWKPTKADDIEIWYGFHVSG
jgi:hypothetical protein